MSLENTDKALAGILDTINKFSNQIQPDVINGFGNVAMLDAQGDLIQAKIWLVVGIFTLIIAIGLSWYGLADENGWSVGGLLVGALSILILGLSISTLVSPLTIASAKDGKVALAAKAVEKIMQKPDSN